MAKDFNNNFQNDGQDNSNMTDGEESDSNSDKMAEFDASNDYSGNPPSNLNDRIQVHIKIFKWHWVAVFAVAVIAIYLSLLNGVSLESALTRAVYCTAIFWIIAEVVDWIIHKMQ